MVEEYLQSKKRGGVSSSHHRDLKYRLGKFVDAFVGRQVASISPHEVESWLYGLCLGAQSTRNFHARLAALFNFGVRRNYLGRNPLEAVTRIKVPSRPPGIYSVEALCQLLAAAPPDLLPSLTVQAFAGLRSSELLRLNWEEVRPRYIEVTAAASKTATRRLVRIEDNLAAWLDGYRRLNGKVYAKGVQSYQEAVLSLHRRVGLERVPNGLRHSFGFTTWRGIKTQPGLR